MTEFNIRRLEEGDYFRGYIKLLQNLTYSPEITYEEFREIYNKTKHNIYILVCEYNDKIISTGTIFIEQKFIHGGKCVGHIEDIVTDINYRNLGITSEIIKRLIDIAINNNCYKIILDCKSELIKYYERFGFNNNQMQMAKYIK